MASPQVAQRRGSFRLCVDCSFFAAALPDDGRVVSGRRMRTVAASGTDCFRFLAQTFAKLPFVEEQFAGPEERFVRADAAACARGSRKLPLVKFATPRKCPACVHRGKAPFSVDRP